MRYQAIVKKEGRATLASFPDCPGCHTQADPGEDIYSMAQDALEGRLEAHLVEGQVAPVPSTRKHRAPAGARTVGIPVSPSLAIRIQLRKARHDAGLSQTALAKRVGVTQQQIAALESPDANLTLGTLLQVAKALGQDVEIGISTSPTRKRRKLQRA
jgi:DNA-binding XRE family transcriptional regulator/predicted RNase H-like HicB family nuclease